MFAGGSRSIRCHEVLLLAYLWLCQSTYTTIKAQTGISPKTIAKWIRIFERVIQLDLEGEDNMIGGEGIIVEIDESKFGKRKNQQGHRVEGY